MKTYLKTFARMFKRHVTRLVSVFLMVLVSVGFTAGIGMSTEKMAYSLDEYYHASETSDLIVRAAAEIPAEKVAAVKEKFGAENVVRGGVIELENGSLVAEQGVTFALSGAPEGMTRIYVRERSSQDAAEVQNSISLPEDDRGENFFEVSFERKNKDLSGFELGSELTFSLTYDAFHLKLAECTLCPTAAVVSPLHFAEYDDPSMKELGEDEYENLANILYITVDEEHPLPQLPMNFGSMLPMNELYVSSPALREKMLFSPAYQSELKEEKAALEDIFREDIDAETAGVLTLEENFSFASFHEYEEKIDAIGYVIMIVFLLVTLLVVLSTMTRLLEEERGQIACMQTLGYSPFAILSKYLLFALVGTLIGGFGAYFAGEGLSYIIYINFSWNYALPAYSMKPAPVFFILSAAVILLSTLAATFAAGMHKTRIVPAVLLRPHTPKAGRKVLLEHIPLLWNRLSFKYKSTMRNVLRFRMRFAMTVVAVMASTGLVVAGLAVLDCCLFQEIGTAAMIGVAVIVLVFAALLNAVVIYTLTNINISERNRELATLMVLGYQTHEVDLYIYREIYITSAIGIAAGLPFGCLLCLFIFNLLEFGSIGAIHWFVWVGAALLSLLFTFAVSLMLRPKIQKINMNESLKAIE